MKSNSDCVLDRPSERVRSRFFPPSHAEPAQSKFWKLNFANFVFLLMNSGAPASVGKSSESSLASTVIRASPYPMALSSEAAYREHDKSLSMAVKLVLYLRVGWWDVGWGWQGGGVKAVATRRRDGMVSNVGVQLLNSPVIVRVIGVPITFSNR